MAFPSTVQDSPLDPEISIFPRPPWMRMDLYRYLQQINYIGVLPWSGQRQQQRQEIDADFIALLIGPSRNRNTGSMVFETIEDRCKNVLFRIQRVINTYLHHADDEAHGLKSWHDIVNKNSGLCWKAFVNKKSFAAYARTFTAIFSMVLRPLCIPRFRSRFRIQMVKSAALEAGFQKLADIIYARSEPLPPESELAPLIHKALVALLMAPNPVKSEQLIQASDEDPYKGPSSHLSKWCAQFLRGLASVALNEALCGDREYLLPLKKSTELPRYEKTTTGTTGQSGSKSLTIKEVSEVLVIDNATTPCDDEQEDQDEDEDEDEEEEHKDEDENENEKEDEDKDEEEEDEDDEEEEDEEDEEEENDEDEGAPHLSKIAQHPMEDGGDQVLIE
ncbi:hypothetical protein VKT23_016910 [Stygiomarasmius scandens]|uniref:Uncharacterized protein n=1 Tax=Marasmiellus scandens TaxID=2682957 RepID=A0ABR1IXX2_9AGAR